MPESEQEHARIVAQESRVISALENPEYDWRTIEGISGETRLPGATVLQILDDLGDKIVRSSLLDTKGRALYTTREHFKKTHGLGSRILNALADRVA